MFFFEDFSYASKASRRIGKSIAPIKLTNMKTSRVEPIAKLITFFCSIRRGAGYKGRVGSIYKFDKKSLSGLFKKKISELVFIFSIYLTVYLEYFLQQPFVDKFFDLM